MTFHNMHIYCEGTPKIKLINTSITSHSCLFFFSMRMRKSNYPCRFQFYDTVLSAVVTMLYMRSLELTHHIADSLYHITNLPISISFHPHDNHQSTVCFYEFSIFLLDSTHKWYHAVFVFFCLTSTTFVYSFFLMS